MAKLRTPVDILVFHHSDKTAEALCAGVKYDFEDCDEVLVTFYDIAFVKPYFSDPLVYTAIGCNGLEMISPWEPERVKQLIKLHY